MRTRSRQTDGGHVVGQDGLRSRDVTLSCVLIRFGSNNRYAWTSNGRNGRPRSSHRRVHVQCRRTSAIRETRKHRVVRYRKVRFIYEYSAVVFHLFVKITSHRLIEPDSAVVRNPTPVVSAATPWVITSFRASKVRGRCWYAWLLR